MAQNTLLTKIIIDLAIVLCLGFALLAIKLWAAPYERGFFTDDTTIRLPFKPDTVSVGLLGALGFALNIVTILTIEFLRDYRGKGIGTKYLFGYKTPGWLWEGYLGVGAFTFGATLQQLSCNTAKYVIGRLRPHFYDVCQPVFNASSPLNALGYIQDYQCTSANQTLFIDSRLSFPSAHSSFAMYSAIFFILYIQLKGKWRGSHLLRHLLQYAVFIAAWYVGLSRVTDHMHHPGDVGVGFAVGAVFAVLVFYYVLKPKKYGAPGSWSGPAPRDELPRPATSL